MDDKDALQDKDALFEALGLEADEKQEVDTPEEKEEEVVEPVEAEEELESQSEVEDVSELTDDDEDEDDYSDVEKEALKLGWKPDGVPGKKKKSADEWMDDYSLYKKINDLGKQVQEKNGILENVAKHLETVRESAYKQAERDFTGKVNELKALANQAYETGEMDFDTILEGYNNDYKALYKDHESEVSKLKEVEEQQKPVKQVNKEELKANLEKPEQEFVEKYDKVLWSQKPEDIAVQTYISGKNAELLEQGLSAAERVAALENGLEQIFPNRFGSRLKSKPSRASKVESNAVAARPGKKFSAADIKPADREMFEQFVDLGVDSKELLQQYEVIYKEEAQNKKRRGAR